MTILISKNAKFFVTLYFLKITMTIPFTLFILLAHYNNKCLR
jgi:hypothetical protein